MQLRPAGSHALPERLMAANVTGGAASQCADLLHDLKTGYLIGAMARYQALAQAMGALAGACIGSAAYLILIPDQEAVDAARGQPGAGDVADLALVEVLAAGRAEDGAALAQGAADVGGAERHEGVVEQAAVAALDAEDVDAGGPGDQVAARIAVFMPGASPPLVRTAIRCGRGRGRASTAACTIAPWQPSASFASCGASR